MRVIAGELGGRRLVAPRGLDTRPTADRVKEALFMALEPLTGLRVVDLFAGSGALGIEALSRGAEFVDFVDDDGRALEALRTNLKTLGIEERARARRLVLPRGMARMEEALAGADLVVLDPPYGGDRALATLRALDETGQLRPRVRVVVEHGLRDTLPERIGRLARERERRYGQTLVTTYRVVDDVSTGAAAPEVPEEPR
jgi:16S rRNA (guanine966-N2)-methyltransferase